MPYGLTNRLFVVVLLSWLMCTAARLRRPHWDRQVVVMACSSARTFSTAFSRYVGHSVGELRA